MVHGASFVCSFVVLCLDAFHFICTEDVVNVEQARIAEEAGAVAVMALERIPADIRVDGGVARMSDPKMIREIKAAVSIPVMAKVGCPLSLVVFIIVVLVGNSHGEQSRDAVRVPCSLARILAILV